MGIAFRSDAVVWGQMTVHRADQVVCEGAIVAHFTPLICNLVSACLVVAAVVAVEVTDTELRWVAVVTMMVILALVPAVLRGILRAAQRRSARD